jgi:hypothetical protein
VFDAVAHLFVICLSEAEAALPKAHLCILISRLQREVTECAWLKRFIEYNMITYTDLYHLQLTDLPPLTDASTDLERAQAWTLAHPTSFSSDPQLQWGPLEADTFIRFCLIRFAGQYLLHKPPTLPAVYDIRHAALDAGWPSHVAQGLQPTHLRLGALLSWLTAMALQEEYADVLRCFEHGLELGYQGPRTTFLSRTSIADDNQNRILTDHVEAEVTKGHIAHLGPYSPNGQTLPSWLEYLRVSPISAIPKRSNGVPIRDKYRVIHNLSHGKLYQRSVNQYIDPAAYTFEFVKFDQICESLRQQGPGAVSFKEDMPNAFKILSVVLRDILLLGFELNGQLYVDTRAPMGAVSIPYLYARFASALQLINQRAMPGQAMLQNYLDDFWKWVPASSVASDPTLLGRLNHAAFRHQLATMNLFPKPDKTVAPCTDLPILGLQFNSVTQEVTVPPERIAALRVILQDWGQRAHASKKDLQSLIGVLSFCCHGVTFGRAFLRRLIDLMASLPFQGSIVELTADMRADVAWWQKFAFSGYQGVSYLMDPTPIELERIAAFFYTDSCGVECAGGYEDDWFFVPFTPEQQREWHIGIKELYSCVVLCKTFGKRLGGRVIVLSCDNTSAVEAIQATRAKDPIMNALVRELFFITSLFSIQVIARYVPGRLNRLADSLSRTALRHLAWTIRPSLSRTPVQPCLPEMTW